MIIRQGTADDKKVASLFRVVVEQMKEDGFDQWNEEYPTVTHIEKNIFSESLHLPEFNGKLLRVVTLNQEGTDVYQKLGESLKNNLVIHRMAVSPHFFCKGVAKQLLSFAEEVARKKKLDGIIGDTYTINEKMIGLFRSYQYQFIGEVNFGKNHLFSCYDKPL